MTLTDLSTTVQKLDHHISLNREARADIDWWIKFLPEWNGKAHILEAKQTFAPDMKLFTDDSGQIGFGIYYQPHWVAERWPPEVADLSIEWKELLPILIACELWSTQWKGKQLLFHSDNMAVVNLWKKGTSAHGGLMSIIRKLFYCSAHNELTANVIHIPGIKYPISDALS